MRAEENLSQAFASKEARLCAIQLYFFEFLTAFAFELRFGKRCLAGKLVDQLQKRFGKFREASEGDGAIVGSGVGREIGAKAAKVLFDLTAGAFCCSGAQNGRSHFGKPRSALDGRRVPGAQK
jgi:hypothetical protein